MRPAVILMGAALALAACNGSRSPSSRTTTEAPGTPGTGPGTDPGTPPGTDPGTTSPEAVLTGALAPRKALSYPTRLAEAASGRLYVTDARSGSVFIFNSALGLIGELKGVGAPLGVVVAPGGNPCVGSRTRRAVLCFDPEGALTRTVGDGLLEMPNDLALDREGNLYVADSTANRVQVFGPGGGLLRSVGVPGVAAEPLSFPAAVAVAYPPAHPEGELYVADQRMGRVAIFDLQGGFRRAVGAPAGSFGGWAGRFTRVQSVAVDALGRVHALDAYQGVVQVLDGETGAFVESYGAFGTGAGQLAVPLGLAILRDGRVVVANTENRRLELLRTLAAGQGG